MKCSLSEINEDRAEKPDIYLRLAIISSDSMFSSIFQRGTAFVFAECAWDVCKVFESDLVGKVDVWPVAGAQKVAEMFDPDVQKILIDSHFCGLLESCLHASAR